MKILISDPDNHWAEKAKILLEKNGLETELCVNGKAIQLKAYRGGVDCLVLDLDTVDYDCFMVLKFMRMNHASIRIVLTIKSKQYLNELGFHDLDFTKLGVAAVLFKPYRDDLFLNTVRGERYDDWKKIKLNEGPVVDEAISLERDEVFTRIKVEACQSGNITIFDHYIRLGAGRFIKVLRKGDFFDQARIDKYKTVNKIEFLYFKTQERTTYINFMNELLAKMVANKKGSSRELIASMKSVSEMYIEEIYTTGIKPNLIEEGKKICQNMFQIVQNNHEIGKCMKELHDQEESTHGHLFLVSFFSTIICKNLDWSSDRTVEMVAMGGLLHDIGKLKLPSALRNKEEADIPENQRAIFRLHPALGYEMLSKSKIVGEPVKKIVSQHHEHVNGTGFPNALTSAKIYPLAKVVTLADGFTTLLTRNHCTPIDGLKILIQNKDEIAKYDAQMIKALVMGLLK